MKLGQNERGPDELAAGAKMPLGDVDSAGVVLVFSPAERDQSASVNEGAHAFSVCVARISGGRGSRLRAWRRRVGSRRREPT